MKSIKEKAIELDRANRRLDAIKGGQCSNEFEEKAKEIYPPELRQKDAETLKASITAEIGAIAEKYD